MLVEFSLACMFHHALEKFFNFMMFTFQENALNLWIFTHAPVPQSKLQVEFFENLFPQDEKGEESYIIRKYRDDLEDYFIYI